MNFDFDIYLRPDTIYAIDGFASGPLTDSRFRATREGAGYYSYPAERLRGLGRVMQR